MRFFAILAIASLQLAAGATVEKQSPALTEDQIRQLIRQVAEKDQDNDRKQRDYTYVERDEERTLDSKGHVKSTETKTYEVMDLYGDHVQRLTAKNDQPLSDQDARKEEKKIQRLMEKRKNESEKDRASRQAKEEKDREDGRKFMGEVADAFNFRLDDIEQIDGRETYVISAEPRPGYHPHSLETRFLTKVRFRAWIDKAELQWKKAEIQFIDTASFGLVLARLHKGTRAIIEQERVNGEVWLPQHVEVKIDARFALLKGLNMDFDTTYRDYRKFRTDSKLIVGTPQPDAGSRSQ